LTFQNLPYATYILGLRPVQGVKRIFVYGQPDFVYENHDFSILPGWKCHFKNVDFPNEIWLNRNKKARFVHLKKSVLPKIWI